MGVVRTRGSGDMECLGGGGRFCGFEVVWAIW